MDIFKKVCNFLNEDQLKAVISDNTRIRCIAGAGSGKSTVLATRVYRLLESRVSNKNIVCLTFTRLAGIEMKEKIEKLTPLGKDVYCNTFHSFCIDILRKYGSYVGFASNFSVIDQERRDEILLEIVKKFNYKKSVKKIQNILSDYYDYGNGSKAINNEDELIIKEYFYYLRKYNVIDMDLILYFTYVLLVQYENIRNYYKESYTHFLIDEAQDTNNVQIAIIETINPTNLFLVGDLRQAIYSWRYCNMDFMLNFQEKYPDSETIILKQNYRSTIQIVSASNKLIRNNNPKHLFGEMISSREGENIEIIEMLTEEEQNEMVAANILGSIPKYNYMDIAILATTNKELDNISKILDYYEIPNVIPSKLNSFTNHKDIKYSINLIEAALNLKDENNIIRILNYSLVLLTENQILKIKNQCLEKNISFFDGLYNGQYENEERVKQCIYKILKLKDYIERHGAAYDVVIYTIKLFNISQDLDCIRLLLQDIEEWTNSQKEFNLNTNISNYFDYLKFKDIQDKLNLKSENKVKLLTMHGSKGLEFPVVYCIGLTEGKFPNPRSDIEEARRLFYVACTRAKDLLKLFSYNKILVYNNKVINSEISTFIKEVM